MVFLLIIFALILSASAIGNVLLYQQNVHLMVLLDNITKDNEKLANTIAETNRSAELRKPAINAEKEFFIGFFWSHI